MRLSDDIILFQNLIENASLNLHIQRPFIEKDYYAITTLKALVSRDNDFVFKGGTSLSVCHNCINRFSEDIDISYIFETLTQSKKRKIKQTFIESIQSVGLNISNIDDIRSDRYFNRYLCPYTSLYGDKDQVIVEWATQTPAFPYEKKPAQTLIGKYLERIKRNDLIEKYELGPFLVKTLSKERTLVDKTFALCDYYVSNRFERESRHIYDISQLLPLIKLNDELIGLFNHVKVYRSKLSKCYSLQSGKPISTLLKEIVKTNAFMSDYNLRTWPLLYDRKTYSDSIGALLTIAEFLENHNL